MIVRDVPESVCQTCSVARRPARAGTVHCSADGDSTCASQAEKSAGVSLPHFCCDADGTNCLNPHANLIDRADKGQRWSPGPQTPEPLEGSTGATSAMRMQESSDDLLQSAGESKEGCGNLQSPPLARSQNRAGPRGCPHSDPSPFPAPPPRGVRNVCREGLVGCGGIIDGLRNFGAPIPPTVRSTRDEGFGCKV